MINSANFDLSVKLLINRLVIINRVTGQGVICY